MRFEELRLHAHLVLPAADYRRNRAAWLEARRHGLGASDTAAILGLSPYRTPLQVWLDKTSTLPVEDVSPSEAAEWGTELEAVVARKVATRHPHLGKLEPTPGLLAHVDHPWMFATVDRLLLQRRALPPHVDGILEVKTVSERGYKDRWIDGYPPKDIVVQVQQQLAVTGLATAWVAVLVGGQRMPDPIRIDRDDDLIARITSEGRDWWHRHVVGGEFPEPTFADGPTLLALFPGDVDLDPVVADEDTAGWMRILLAAREAKKASEAAATEALVHVQAAMGDATTLIDEDGEPLATWRPRTTNRVDLDLLRQTHPQIAEACTRPTSTRVFLPVIPKESL
jgi:putative phage-type endonuclease